MPAGADQPLAGLDRRHPLAARFDAADRHVAHLLRELRPRSLGVRETLVDTGIDRQFRARADQAHLGAHQDLLRSRLADLVFLDPHLLRARHDQSCPFHPSLPSSHVQAIALLPGLV